MARTKKLTSLRVYIGELSQVKWAYQPSMPETALPPSRLTRRTCPWHRVSTGSFHAHEALTLPVPL